MPILYIFIIVLIFSAVIVAGLKDDQLSSIGKAHPVLATTNALLQRK